MKHQNPKKLYRVRYTIDEMVLADDETEAKEVARDAILSNTYDVETHADIECVEATHTTDVPEHWMDSSPWGGDCKEMVSEIVKEVVNSKNHTLHLEDAPFAHTYDRLAGWNMTIGGCPVVWSKMAVVSPRSRGLRKLSVWIEEADFQEFVELGAGE